MKYRNNKSNRLTFLILFILATGLVSCEKLLEIPSHPDDKLSTTSVYLDSNNVMSALVGLYANLKVGGSGGTVFGGELTRYMSYYSDELQPSNAGGNTDEFLSNSVQPTNNVPGIYWDNCYAGIYQTNALLEGLTNNDKLSLSLQKQVKGETLMVRALYYFYLVNLFGPVPLVTATDYKITSKIPRSSVDAIYDLIQSDLNMAEELLPVNYPSAGRARPNKHTARALLARTYLYRKEWKKAADMASLIISDPMYKLPKDLSTVFQEGSTEAIWHVASVADYLQLAEVSYFVPYYSFQTPQSVFTDEQKDAFETNDKRQNDWIGTSIVENQTYFYPYKYKNPEAYSTPKELLMFFRLAEQYLIRAEANAHLNLLDAAREDINKIRDRADLGVTPAVTQEEVLLAIEHERQTELFCELGHRWFDLNRTGRAKAVLSPIKPLWNDRALLLPVPQIQRQYNPFLSQNPGYN